MSKTTVYRCDNCKLDFPKREIFRETIRYLPEVVGAGTRVISTDRHLCGGCIEIVRNQSVEVKYG